MLRRFCVMCGVQILLKDFAFDSKTKAAFAEEDIVNLFPVVKHINPRVSHRLFWSTSLSHLEGVNDMAFFQASDAYNFYTTGQAKIQQGQLRAGYDLVAEALNLLNNVYGAMHPEIAQCLRLLARLAYILGDHQEALANQHKAVLMSERCNGVDHPQTILEYVSEMDISLRVYFGNGPMISDSSGSLFVCEFASEHGVETSLSSSLSLAHGSWRRSSSYGLIGRECLPSRTVTLNGNGYRFRATLV